MKVIVAGSRTVQDEDYVFEAIRESEKIFGKITEIVSGMAAGPDHIGRLYAQIHDIPRKEMPADWAMKGRRAGYLRNVEMAEYVGPDGGLLAIWDGHSKGTRHMIDIAREKVNMRKIIIAKFWLYDLEGIVLEELGKGVKL